MKKIKQTLVVLTLFGTICLGTGCDRFSDAILNGVSGVVSNVTAELISAALPFDLDS